jgi:1,4-dihydroxy-6-naphthoate synthase
VNQKIDTGDLSFDVQLQDVETLNEMAINNQLDFTKISYGVLPLVARNYKVLNSGSALGKGVGPLLIAKKIIDFNGVEDYTIAIPGENTTAHLLFSLAFPNAKKKAFLRYDAIEKYVSENENRLGVIIHENRFTYMERVFYKIVDLGTFWEEKTGLPIHLGGIAGKRNLDDEVLKTVDALIKNSIEFAFKNYPLIPDYVRKHSQEMEPEVMKKHIDLYVNNYSIDLGTDGKNAIQKFMEIYNNTHKHNEQSGSLIKDLFVEKGKKKAVL